ncbi:MAG: hypothetical protein OXE95_08435 [Chloroflexi bacterium]|nr:hypothetical protein [Chloroflexota bacterium]MCY4247585.1 hypothetical protein [Chloroflexota bacterium]
MKSKMTWCLLKVPLRWSLALALTLLMTTATLAQFDALGDKDRCFLGQLAYCPDAPEAEVPEKSEPKSESEKKETKGIERESVSTCLSLPPRIAVSGFNMNTHCQIVSAAGIAQFEALQHVFVDALDVWGVVPGGTEVCFQSSGVLAFLDANDAPRTLYVLQTYERDGMTCGMIDNHGTVVQLNSLPPIAGASATQPTSEAIAAGDCLIKLTETVHLRTEPDGESFGLVWMNSEVPVIETIGPWHKVIFEGQTGYISRLYNTVLRGSCE